MNNIVETKYVKFNEISSTSIQVQKYKYMY